MRKTLLLIAAIALAAGRVGAATLFTDNFDADGNVNGSIANWTKTPDSTLFGGVGTETNAAYPNASVWAYFQVNGTNTAGIYRSAGVMGLAGSTITLQYDFGGRTDNNLYTGTFTASIYDGNPTAGGTLLMSRIAADPASGGVSTISFNDLLTNNTTSQIYVEFNAGISGNNAFQQPIIDNVSISSVPEPSTISGGCLMGIAAIAAARRRRR